MQMTSKNPQDRRAQRLRRPAMLQRVSHGAAIGLLSALAACVASEPERLTCDDVSAPDPTDFAQLAALISAPDGKGCANGQCHGVPTQEQGLRLDTPSLIFEELTTRTNTVYAMVASGEMPDHGTPWDANDLRLFRSWYCNGALP
jgi:hypothetical protein